MKLNDYFVYFVNESRGLSLIQHFISCGKIFQSPDGKEEEQ